MYELLAGCDAFLTDYSSAAFDAMAMRIPVFLCCDDYSEYQKERGSLLWNLNELPFPMGQTTDELTEKIEAFDEKKYQNGLDELMEETGMQEDGRSSRRVVEALSKIR